MSYHRLNEDERETISRMLAQGCSLRGIARTLGRNVSTISNEVVAGGCNRYLSRATRAHRGTNDTHNNPCPAPQQNRGDRMEGVCERSKEISRTDASFHDLRPRKGGTNENMNGLIRQFFPKGTDFSKISRRAVKHVQHLLNGRPRKVLNWATPYEVFHTLLR